MWENVNFSAKTDAKRDKVWLILFKNKSNLNVLSTII